MPRIEWIPVASATHARLLQREPGLPLVPIAAFSHPEGRRKASLPVDLSQVSARALDQRVRDELASA